MKIVKPSVELLWITGEPEKMIQASARTCYKSEAMIKEGSEGPFCDKMKKLGHHAMIEHAVASFRIVCDRGISHEIVRHRLASYAQESTRYCRYSDDKFDGEISVIEPPGLPKTSHMFWVNQMVQAESTYLNMLNDGCPPQIARSVLPTCTKTELVMTANFREWRHFIQLRGSKAAHPQIRPIACAVWEELMKRAPNVFDDLRPEV